MPFTFFLPSPPLDHRNVPGGPPAGSRDDLAGGAAAVQDPALDSMRAFWWGELTTMWRKHERERESLQKHVNESICNKRRRRTSYHYNWLLGPTGPHLPRSSTVLKQKKLQHASLDAPVLYHLQGYCYTCVLPPPPHLTPLRSFLHPSDFHHFPPPTTTSSPLFCRFSPRSALLVLGLGLFMLSKVWLRDSEVSQE